MFGPVQTASDFFSQALVSYMGHPSLLIHKLIHIVRRDNPCMKQVPVFLPHVSLNHFIINVENIELNIRTSGKKNKFLFFFNNNSS